MKFCTPFRRAIAAIQGDSFRSKLIRGSVGSAAIKTCSMLLGFLLTLVLARALGSEGYGLYSFALALITTFAIPTQLGLPTLVVRETAKAYQSNNWPLMKGLWRWANRYVFAFSFTALLTGSLLIMFTSDWIEEIRLLTVAAALPLIPLIALGNLRGASLRGLERVTIGLLPEFIVRPALAIALIATATSLGTSLSTSPILATGLHVIAALISFACGAALLLQIQPKELREVAEPQYQEKYWKRAAPPLALLAGLQVINAQIGVIMLGIFQSDSDVGIFRVTTQLAALAAFGLQVCNLVVQPHIARLYQQKDMAQLQKLVTYAARGSLMISIPPAMLFIFCAQLILTSLFGESFQEGARILVILTVGQLINAGVGSVGNILNMTGHERDSTRGVAIASVCSIILNSLLIPPYGLYGAAVASAATLIIWNLILWRYAKLRMGIETSAIGARM